MKGYHYTSYENYLKIKEKGLKTYLIDKEELRKVFPGGVIGIWLWRKMMDNRENFGSIIFQVARKGTEKVVLLEVSYSKRSIISECIDVKHDGSINTYGSNNFVYHKGTPSVIVVQDIPPEDIKLIKIWDLPELLKV
jgi:hypothetical protein